MKQYIKEDGTEVFEYESLLECITDYIKGLHEENNEELLEFLAEFLSDYMNGTATEISYTKVSDTNEKLTTTATLKIE